MANFLRSIASRTIGLVTSRGGQLTIASSGACLLASFQMNADEKDFFSYEFTTRKKPDAIVDFYSTEEFLQVLGVIPFATHMILAGVVWDENEENTNTVWNTMRISFDITEKEEEIDGADVVTFFNKRERFIQWIPYTKFLLWDQVQNYGYKRQPDGTILVSHQGESFYGPWPVRLLVGLHARYVIWATEKHINSELFGTEDLEEIEHQRANIPAYVVKEWMASLTQKQEAAIEKSRLSGKSSENAEETLRALKKLQRQDTSIAIERTPGQKGVLTDNVRVRFEDPAAQKAIRDTLKNLKDVEGGDAAAAALGGLINHKQAQGLVRRSSTLDKKKVDEKKKPEVKAAADGMALAKQAKNEKFGWESTEKYGGAFKAAKRINRQPSTTPDELALWRTEARSLRLMEGFDEALVAINARPEKHNVRLPDGLDFNDVIAKVCHKHCIVDWESYTQCKGLRKGSHEKCDGWWHRYKNCLDSSSPKIVLAALEGVAQYDHDPNMIRLRQ